MKVTLDKLIIFLTFSVKSADVFKNKSAEFVQSQ